MYNNMLNTKPLEIITERNDFISYEEIRIFNIKIRTLYFYDRKDRVVLKIKIVGDACTISYYNYCERFGRVIVEKSHSKEPVRILKTVYKALKSF